MSATDAEVRTELRRIYSRIDALGLADELEAETAALSARVIRECFAGRSGPVAKREVERLKFRGTLAQSLVIREEGPEIAALAGSLALERRMAIEPNSSRKRSYRIILDTYRRLSRRTTSGG